MKATQTFSEYITEQYGTRNWYVAVRPLKKYKSIEGSRNIHPKTFDRLWADWDTRRATAKNTSSNT